MADRPFQGRTLTPGQIRQVFESHGCVKIKDNLPTSQAWRAPTGQVFWVPLDEIDAAFIEEIIDLLEIWLKKSRGKK